jgi:hypothetical protein
MRVRGNVKNGEIHYSSPITRHRFLEAAEGKYVYIAIDDAPTANSRRYFEGALVPAVFYQHPNSGWEDFKECREALKLEFLPAYTRSVKGDRIKYARSTTELNKKAFVKLIEDISAWLEANGMEVPNPEDYKAWQNSAPAAGEVYPPLERLKQVYNKNKYNDRPWRKK